MAAPRGRGRPALPGLGLLLVVAVLGLAGTVHAAIVTIVRSDLVPQLRAGSNLSVEEIRSLARSHPELVEAGPAGLARPLHYARYNILDSAALRRGGEDGGERAGPERRRTSDMTLIGFPSTAYSIIMDFGQPVQQLACVVDTGSSNLAVAGAQQGAVANWLNMAASNTLEVEADSFSVEYVSASFTAQRVRDYVSIQAFPQKMTEKIEFGAITKSINFFETGTMYQGILGLGFIPLAMPAKSPIAPFWDLFRPQTGIADLFSIELCDIKDKDNNSGGYGRMSMGELLPGSSMVGTIYYTNLKRRAYYEIAIMEILWGTEPFNIPCYIFNSPGYSIVDTGTTDILVPVPIHEALVAKVDSIISRYSPGSLGNAKQKKAFYSGEVCSFAITDELVQLFPPLVFAVESTHGDDLVTDLKVHPWHYMRAYTDKTKRVCRKFAVLPHCTSGSGIVLGIALLANYVTVFDREYSRVGFASSTCSGFYNSSGAQLSVEPLAPPRLRHFNDSCLPDTTVKCPEMKAPLGTLSYVAIAFGSAAVVMIFVVCAMYCKQRRQQRSGRQYRELSTFPDTEDEEPDAQELQFDVRASNNNSEPEDDEAMLSA